MAVGVPIGAVLALAIKVVTTLTMHQQGGQIDGVNVRNHTAERAHQTKAPRLQDVTEVVDVAGHTPESTGQQFCATLSLQVLRLVTTPDLQRGHEEREEEGELMSFQTEE
jgi:hypothetical protein